MNENGEVIFSSFTSGELATVLDGQDLRKSSGESLAYAAKKMVGGSNGISAVTIDNEEYILAYAPIKSIGWSFAALTLRKNIGAAAMESRDYFLDQIELFLRNLNKILH